MLESIKEIIENTLGHLDTNEQTKTQTLSVDEMNDEGEMVIENVSD